MKEIGSAVTLPSEPGEVWAVLTDFASYPEWNPFLLRMESAPREGERFKAMSRLPSGIKLGFVGTILSFTEDKEIRWEGHPRAMPASAMHVEHTFTLEPVEEGTRLTQSEICTGFMIPISGWILGQAQKGQVKMNDALAERLSSV